LVSEQPQLAQINAIARVALIQSIPENFLKDDKFCFTFKWRKQNQIHTSQKIFQIGEAVGFSNPYWKGLDTHQLLHPL